MSAASSPTTNKNKNKPKNDNDNDDANINTASSPTANKDSTPNYFDDPFPVNDRRVRSRIFYFPHVVGNISVCSAERRIAGVDDPVYEKNLRTVWELLPRGQARFFELPEGTDIPEEAAKGAAQSGPLPQGATLRGEVFGMRKFGYRESSYGFRDKVDSVMCIEKVNGECAHVSGCVIGPNKERCWLTGSKHTHMIIPDSVISDANELPRVLATVYADGRYIYASKIARMLGAMVAKLSAENRALFLDSLIANKWTANAEAILAEEQHLVDYGGISELRFFAISFNGRSPDGLCLAPEKAFELFKKCGLAVAKALPRVKYNSSEYVAQIDRVAKSSNFEGVVVYGSSEDGRVACVWKEKSYPYVMERIAREAITGRKMVGELLRVYLLKRLSTQPADLRAHFAEWEEKRLPYLVDFATYLLGKGAFNSDNASQLRGKWLKLQKDFEATSEAERKLLAQRAESLIKKSAPSDRDVCMFVGPPGSGKSTLARGLQFLLKKVNFANALWINQDECGGKRNVYLEAIKKAMADAKNTHVILDKCNLDPQNRKDYDDLGFSPTVTFVFVHPEGTDELAELCVARAKNRGSAHKSLLVKTDKDVETVQRVVYSMLENFDEKAMDTGVGSLITLDVTKTPAEQLLTVWNGLKGLSCKDLPDVTPEVVREVLDRSRAYEASLAK